MYYYLNKLIEMMIMDGGGDISMEQSRIPVIYDIK
jgi:hypothetical protein